MYKRNRQELQYLLYVELCMYMFKQLYEGYGGARTYITYDNIVKVVSHISYLSPKTAQSA